MLLIVIQAILHNKVLMVSILSWATAQLLKLIITFIQDKKWDFTTLVSPGGMPSSHSSFVTALTVSIGQVQGFGTPLFAACAVISTIIMYDATGVRWEAGQQAAVINKIVEMLQDPNIKLETQLKEILGHTPLQVFAGIMLGVMFGVVCF